MSDAVINFFEGSNQFHTVTSSNLTPWTVVPRIVEGLAAQYEYRPTRQRLWAECKFDGFEQYPAFRIRVARRHDGSYEMGRFNPETEQLEWQPN